MLQTRSSLALTCIALGLLSAASACAKEEAAAGHVRFSADTWQLSGDTTSVSPDGKTLSLDTGRAVYPGIDFENGTIEFDLEVTHYRSFVFVAFRIQEEGELEEIYFRPHNSLLPDAIQYTPSYKGRSQWQLYHGGRSTAAAPLPPGEQIHVKLVLEHQLGAVYVGDMAEPRLRFLLTRPAAAGDISLRAFLPPIGNENTPSDHPPTARFSNLSIRPNVIEESLFRTTQPLETPDGWISQWALSPAFAPADGPIRELPSEVLASEGWQTVRADIIHRFVELERHLVRPENARRAAVLARLVLTAPEATTRRLKLGFSDEISVFLNGRLIVSSDDSYSFNAPRRQGLLTSDQLSVYLPLEPGENELVLAVSDSFGGWGLTGELEDRAGLGVEAR